MRLFHIDDDRWRCDNMPKIKTDEHNRTATEFRKFTSEIREWAIEKGWRNSAADPRDPAGLLMLITTEIAEACEAFREGNPPCDRPGMGQYTHAEEELADAIIRILQMGDEFQFDVPGALMAKMRFNWTREHKHGKKF